MKLLSCTDPFLRQKCLPFNFEEGYTLPNGDMLDAQEVFDLLKRTMVTNRGIGLAGPQIGIMARVFVIGNPDEEETIIPVFNPRIVDVSSDLVEVEEGCLSFPGLFLKIDRPRTIRARYANQFGVMDTINFDGFTSRIFQHEFDHLDGKLYTSYVSRMELDRARNKQKKINRSRRNHQREFRAKNQTI